MISTLLKPEQLTENQQDTIDYIFEHDEAMIIAPKGFGKCIVGYTAILDLLRDNVLKQVLILAPAQVCTQVWAKEPAKWTHLAHLLPNNAVACLTGQTEAKRKALMAAKPQIVICNFEILAWLFKTYPNHYFDGLLVDEITKLKSIGGTGYKKLRPQLKKFTWRVAMTADPVAQESIEIYGQMLIVDQGARLGRNNDNFKRKYFMQMDYAGRKWDPQPGGLDRLTKVLSDITYTVDSADYDRSLSTLTDIDIEVHLPDDVRLRYVEMKKDNVTTIQGKELIAPTEASLGSKLFQMCCGAVYRSTEDDDLDDISVKKETLLLHDAKMDALDKIIKATTTPILVAYQFSFQCDALIKKYNAPVFSAKNSTAVNDKILVDWEADKIPMLLVHPKSAGHGLNFQYGSCHTLVCMSYFWSADEWDQLIGRLRRRGQKSPIVNRYTIYCRNTIEDCAMKPLLQSRKEASEFFHSYLKGAK